MTSFQRWVKFRYEKTVSTNTKKENNKQTIDRFKVVADKDMRKMSNIVEN